MTAGFPGAARTPAATRSHLYRLADWCGARRATVKLRPSAADWGVAVMGGRADSVPLPAAPRSRFRPRAGYCRRATSSRSATGVEDSEQWLHLINIAAAWRDRFLWLQQRGHGAAWTARRGSTSTTIRGPRLDSHRSQEHHDKACPTRSSSVQQRQSRQLPAAAAGHRPNASTPPTPTPTPTPPPAAADTDSTPVPHRQRPTPTDTPHPASTGDSQHRPRRHGYRRPSSARSPQRPLQFGSVSRIQSQTRSGFGR